MFADRFDIALSYSSTTTRDADAIVKRFSGVFTIYDYRLFLPMQLGLDVADLADEIYSSMPTIVLVTQDWWTRPATMLECVILKRNREPKLIFDYSGSEREKILAAGIQKICWGEFGTNELIDFVSVERFLSSCFRPSDNR